MNSSQRLKILMDSGRSVFTLKNLQQLWVSNAHTTKIVASRMVVKGIIYRYARGYYGLRKDFDTNEIANIIITPSYISLQTALFFHNISFQVSNFVTSVGLISYQRRIDNYLFRYYAMKESLFFNLSGIEYKSGLAIAKPERAILDCLYFGLLPNIDNFQRVNLTYLKELAEFYPNSVAKEIQNIRKERS